VTSILDSDQLGVEDIDFALDDLGDLAALTARMRAEGPATWVRFIGEPALHLNTYELVDAAFRDEQHVPGWLFSKEVQEPYLGRTVMSLGGDDHRVARSLQSPFFRQRLMPTYVTPLFEPVANALIDEFVAQGEADLVPGFTQLYPMRVIMRILDLPETPGVDWAGLAWAMIRYAYDPESGARALVEFDRLVEPVIHERRRNPGQDLISALVTAEIDGDTMTDTDVLSFVRLMFPAGSDTTYLGMGNILTALLTHPDAMAQLRADPEGETRWAIEEGLRWQPSVAHLTRRTLDEMDWHGLHLPARTSLLLSVMAANHDPAVFPDPDTFDLGRRPTSTITFGLAAHHCLGIHFARAEMDVALRTLLARLPDLRLQDPSDPPEIHGALLRGPDQLRVRFG
jgi:cytochrome P450